MYCTNCGQETKPKNSTCTHCGFDLSHVIALLNEPDDSLGATENIVRTAEEIAKRALTLAAVISCAYGDSRADVVAWLKQEWLWDEATPSEQEFLLGKTSHEARLAFTWKIEALVPLLWSIYKITNMPGLNRQCDTEYLKKAVIWPPHPTHEYIASAKVRGEEELRKEYEKVYEAHWKVRDAKMHGKNASKGLNPEVVHERHYGFNWLIGYKGQPWDEITTDT